MNKIILAIYLILSTNFFAYSQSFEGTLTYVSTLEISPKMEKMGMTKASLLEQLRKEGSWSDTSITSYKNGNYHILFYTQPKSWSIYKTTTNKIYSLQTGINTCTVTNASVDLEQQLMGKPPIVQKIDTSVMIYGHNCSMVRVKWKTGTYEYYYDSTDLIIDPTLYAKHIYDGWAAFLAISHTLPIRVIKKTNGMMTITTTLINIKAGSIDDKLFILPELIADKDLNTLSNGNREVMRVKE